MIRQSLKYFAWFFIPFLCLWALWHLVFGPAQTNRFRLTIEIDTPAGVKSSANVYEHQLSALGTFGYVGSIRGDAVFVDLGQGKHVIAIMAHGEKAQTYADLDRPTRADGPRNLTQAQIPTLVTFDDLKDPKTARVVYAGGRKIEMSNTGQQAHDRGPELKIDDIAKVFGAGYRFKRTTLEMVPVGWRPFNLLGLTGTPVTRGIEKRLPWAKTHPRYLSGQFACGPSEPHCLHGGHFYIP